MGQKCDANIQILGHCSYSTINFYHFHSFSIQHVDICWHMLTYVDICWQCFGVEKFDSYRLKTRRSGLRIPCLGGSRDKNLIVQLLSWQERRAWNEVWPCLSWCVRGYRNPYCMDWWPSPNMGIPKFWPWHIWRLWRLLSAAVFQACLPSQSSCQWNAAFGCSVQLQDSRPNSSLCFTGTRIRSGLAVSSHHDSHVPKSSNRGDHRSIL